MKFSESGSYIFSGAAAWVIGGLLFAMGVWCANQTLISSRHTTDITEIKETVKGLASDVQKQQVYLARMASGIDYLSGGRRGNQPPPAAAPP